MKKAATEAAAVSSVVEIRGFQLSYIPAGGRCWIRTSDPFRVKEVLYP